MERKPADAGRARRWGEVMTTADLHNWMWHGGALRKAQAAYPTVQAPWIDLSTGINPNPWPHAADIAIDWHRLPELEELQALEAAAAQHYGVPASHICAVSGSEMAMRLTGLLLGGTGQCERGGYRSHGEMFATYHMLDTLDQANPRCPLILANPANPSGRIINRADLNDLLDQRPDMWTLVDEAYADAMPQFSIANQVTERPKLIIFKSLGKFFGLAGLRLGFVIAAPQWISIFRRHIGAWPVSAAAIAMGQAALGDRAWIANTRQMLSQRAAQLDELLNDSGLQPSGDCPLFRRLYTDDARSLFHHLCQHGILTRPFADAPHHLRLGLPANDTEFDRLETALRHV
jgi:cobalamin biosynthetic protein CobC